MRLKNETPSLIFLARSVDFHAPSEEVEAQSLIRETPSLADEALNLAAEIPKLADEARTLAGETLNLADEALNLVVEDPNLIDEPSDFIPATKTLDRDRDSIGVTHPADVAGCAPTLAGSAGIETSYSHPRNAPMNRKKIFAIILVAVLFGYATGVVGMIVTHRQEAESGPLPHHFDLEWATAPAFPGFIMAELFTDHEWHADKTWCSGQDISLWNAGFWGLAAMILAVPSAVGHRRRGVAVSTP